MGAFINIRIIETDHRRLVFGNRRKFGSQRGVHLVQPFCHRLLHTDTEHLYRHRIQLRHFIVHCRDNNPPLEMPESTNPRSDSARACATVHS